MAEKVWRPHARQEAFIQIPDSVFEGFYGGAAGGGKSELLLLLPIVRGFYRHPEFKGLILRRTFPELEKSIILRSQKYYSAAGATYQSQHRRWRFPSGAIVDFGYAEHEKDVRRYDTTEYNYIALDELTSFTEFQYLYLTSRCRTSVSDLPAIVRSASNPGNIGHGWCRKRFVEPYKTGEVLIRDVRTNQLRIFIPARLTDNPYLTKADPEYGSRLEMLPEAERRAKLYGDWWTFSGQVFDEFRAEHFIGEPENAIHVIPPFEVPDYWPRLLSVDWGFTARTIALWGAVSPDERVFVYREYCKRRSKISSWTADIARLSENEDIDLSVLDPSAWQHRGEEKTIAEQASVGSGIMFKKADNDRLGGKILVHEFLRWEQRPLLRTPKADFDQDYANKIYRTKGPDALKEYLIQYEPEKPEVLPRLQIFNTCTELIKCVPLCVYADANADGKPSEDVKEFDGDDAYDDLRYLLKAVDHYTKEVKREFLKKMELGEIIKRLKMTNDQTTFYRQMEVFEAKKTGLAPVRKFRNVMSRLRGL